MDNANTTVTATLETLSSKLDFARAHARLADLLAAAVIEGDKLTAQILAEKIRRESAAWEDGVRGYEKIADRTARKARRR